MPWPTSNHESPDVNLTIPAVTAPHYLWAFLMADGQPFRADDYAVARQYLEQAVQSFSQRRTGGQTPDPNVSDQRLRTWKAAFEEMGLLTVADDGAVQATRFGRAVVDGWEAVDTLLKGNNRRIATLGAEVANRVLLAKPNNNGEPPPGVPPDADIRPLRAMWRAFRHLGDRLHWQDVNRVLGHVHYERDVSPALEAIEQFRRTHAGTYPEAALGSLGEPLSNDPRHITPWFNRAGIGGLLIPSDMDGEGFRSLPPDSVTIFDGLLAEQTPPVPDLARRQRAAYIAYLMEPVERASRPALDIKDRDMVERIVSAARQFGGRNIITLAGLPGTGKSRVARIAADILTDGDPLRLKDIQFHESTTYEDFMEGFVPRSDGQGFERRLKTFRIINRRALDDQGKTYVLLIEELTRANIHAVLGELLTFVEHRGRKFTLSLSQEETEIAPNLVIIATMNPRDRSALSLDDAVGRRLHRIVIPPSVQALSDMLADKLSAEDLNALAGWYEVYISILPFGHGVFAEAGDAAQLRSIWEGKVVPLLCDPLGRVLDVYQPACDAFPFRETHG